MPLSSGVHDERPISWYKIMYVIHSSFLFPQNHLAHCPFATVPCPHCQQSVKKTLLEEHTMLECRRRPVSCPDCVETFVYEEKEVTLALELEK